MQKTNIEWADSTWNPVTGCHNNCPYCYARSIANRFKSKKETLKKKMKFSCMSEHQGKDDAIFYGEYHCPFPFGFSPTFYEERLDEPQHHKKPQRIFVCSMADLFGSWIPDKWILQVFDACKAAPQHKYMFLTKFPNRYYELLSKDLLPELPNFYYGTTVNTNNSLNNPFWNAFWVGLTTYHTFLSIEPILGDMQGDNQDLPAIFTHDLMIFGAETGNRKDKVIPKKEWIQPLVDECVSMGVSVFMKDSLIPIIGEDHMLRRMPNGLQL